MGDSDTSPGLADKVPAKGAAESTLLWLVKSGPLWARVPAVVVSLAVTLTSPALLLYRSAFPSHKTLETHTPKDVLSTTAADSASGQQLQMAATAQDSYLIQKVQAALKDPSQVTPEARDKLQIDLADALHEMAHLSNPQDDVPWRVFDKQSDKDYFGFKVYPTDKCLLIARIENGRGSSEWLRDPNLPHAPTQPQHANALDQVPRVDPMVPTTGLSMTISNLPNAQESLQAIRFVSAHIAAYRQPTQDTRDIDKTPVQGSCLASHPWPWTGGWGSPINQCQTPFFRTWADGCSHVQIFDHCQNVWGPVVWQFCAAYHHP